YERRTTPSSRITYTKDVEDENETERQQVLNTYFCGFYCLLRFESATASSR
ncbi:unnamed protein product, partial [Amoebophrya sp. A120]